MVRHAVVCCTHRCVSRRHVVFVVVYQADKRTLKYVRADHLRQRVVCSLLSSRPVIVSRIRDTDEAPGLRGELRGRYPARLGVNVPALVMLLLAGRLYQLRCGAGSRAR